MILLAIFTLDSNQFKTYTIVKKITERNTNPPYSLTIKAKADPGSYLLKTDQRMVIPVTGSLWLTKVPF